MRRVVITGLGLVTPIGVGVSRVWTSLLSGACGVVALPAEQYANLPCRLAAVVPDLVSRPDGFDWSKFSGRERRQVSRGIAFGIEAADQAYADGGLETLTEAERERVGVAIGMGVADLDDIHNTGNLLDAHSYTRISPYFVPRILTNMAAGNVSIRYGLRGPNHSASTACTTGAHSVGDAFNFIRLGAADAMLCGGADACVSPIALAGFARCRALSTSFHDSPREASRPFDRRRDGFVIGEGAGVLLLEALDHALGRAAPHIYGEVVGYGLSADAHHLTSPDEQGRGAQLCMRRAIDDAGVRADELEHVNAHATSTPLGDRAESVAISRVLGDSSPAVCSTKGAVGHLLGAAGAVEAVFTALAIHHGHIPPTCNLHSSDIDCGLHYVAKEPLKWTSSTRIALNNSFGFGGTNASLILCLHGYRQDADTFRAKTGAFRKALKGRAEFVFLNAPHCPDLPSEAVGVGSSNPRAWWFSRRERQFSAADVTDVTVGFDASIAHINDAIRMQGPFDGVMGFSQGACMAALFCQHRLAGELPACVRFLILVAAFRSKSTAHQQLSSIRLPMATLHVYGQTDSVISEMLSSELASLCDDATTVRHDGGHLVPTATQLKGRLNEFLDRFLTDVSANCVT